MSRTCLSSRRPREYPTIERAYLSQHFIEGMHTEPGLLIAIVSEEEKFERIAGAVGVIARDTPKAQTTVDVWKLDPAKLGGHFSQQIPLYVRKN